MNFQDRLIAALYESLRSDSNVTSPLVKDASDAFHKGQKGGGSEGRIRKAMFGKNKYTKHIADTGVKGVEAKLKLKSGSTNISTAAALQIGARAKRKTTGGIPNLDKKTSQADAKRDTWRRMAPGDK